MAPVAFVAAFEPEMEALLVGYGISLEIEAVPDAIRIEGLLVPPPRRRHGLGEMALSVLCRAADRHGMILEVLPEPITILVDSPIPRTELERLYERAGFMRVEATQYWRRPAHPPIVASTTLSSM